MQQTPILLEPEDDGLLMRPSKPYAQYKLRALEHYLTMTNNAMHNKPWIKRYYIDLEAGPGKNRIGNSIVLGSPLIALKAPNPPDRFIFNELKKKAHQALTQRVTSSPLRERISVFQADANDIVDQVCNEIAEQDRIADLKTSESIRVWSAFNIAFLDPEGLEIDWETISKLAQLKKMDLIINFSTSGVRRSIGRGNLQAVDRFFGTPDWRHVLEQPGSHMKRGTLIEFIERIWSSLAIIPMSILS